MNADRRIQSCPRVLFVDEDRGFVDPWKTRIHGKEGCDRMSCTVDHLREGQRVRVLRDFADARGFIHRSGEAGLLCRLELDWAEQEIRLTWKREGREETLVFGVAATNGPSNGRMREYFEVQSEAGAQDRVRRVPRPAAGEVAAAIPALEGGLIRDASRHHDALQRVWALAGRLRFAEAEEQLRAVMDRGEDVRVDVRSMAGELGAMAAAHAGDGDRRVYRWLRDRAMQLWHAWGATATSGGEGCAMSLEIEAARRRFEALDRGGV